MKASQSTVSDSTRPAAEASLAGPGFSDNRPEAAVQRKQLHVIHSAPPDSRVVQMMKASEIQLNERYRYTDFDDGGEKTGTLVKKGGGWYVFDNGRARSADNVLAKEGAVAPLPGPQLLPVVPPQVPVHNVPQPATVQAPQPSTSSAQDNPSDLRSLFNTFLDHLGIKDANIRNLLVDLNDNELAVAAADRKLRSYRANWADYTSCFATSERLLDLFGDPNSFNTNSWGLTGEFPAQLGALLTDLGEMTKQNVSCVYRVGVFRRNSQDHSFAIVLRNGTAELLQSFAGVSSGEAFGTNLGNKGSLYDVRELVTFLDDLLNASDDKRKDAQVRLFGGRIDGGADLRTGGFLMKLDRRGLYSISEIRNAIAEKIRKNLEIVGKHLRT